MGCMHEFCCASTISLLTRLCKLLTVRDLCCTFSISLALMMRMLFANLLFMGVALLTAVYCQSLPQFENEGHFLSNNSYIYYPDIGDDRDRALKCVTDSVNCCNNSTVGGWRDESGRQVYQGADGATCLYVTRGDGVISLHRKRGCTDHTSGLWRCDIPDSSGEMQSLYAYIGYERHSNPPGKDTHK